MQLIQKVTEFQFLAELTLLPLKLLYFVLKLEALLFFELLNLLTTNILIPFSILTKNAVLNIMSTVYLYQSLLLINFGGKVVLVIWKQSTCKIKRDAVLAIMEAASFVY